jgi:hypothetical protein
VELEPAVVVVGERLHALHERRQALVEQPVDLTQGCGAAACNRGSIL